MKITGTLPSLIANQVYDEIPDEIITKGNDIDIHFEDNGTVTVLYAIAVSNKGEYEIVEIDDPLNLLPEYDKGDIIGKDAISKLLMSSINSNVILSINLRGKAHYKRLDKQKEKQKKKEEKQRARYEKKAYRKDLIDVQTAQEFIRSYEGFGSAKVGKVELMNKKYGGNYKALVGNPPTQDYSVWQLYRNGDDFRVLDIDNKLSAEQAIQIFDELEGNKYDGSPREEPVTKEQESDNVIDTEEPNTEEPDTEQESDNVIDEQKIQKEAEKKRKAEEKEAKKAQKEQKKQNKKAEKERQKKADKKEVGTYDWKDLGDGFAYKIVGAMLKHKKEEEEKKSKYNGCNVTGCEDGNLTGQNTGNVSEGVTL